MKRYYLTYKSNEIVCGRNEHTYGYANALSTAKGYIRRCRKQCEKDEPRDFRIYDTQGDEDYAVCVYYEK